MYDDFFHLRYLLAFSPLQYFLDPAIWQQGPEAVLTPAFLLSMEADLALFGLRPAPFLAHHLVALAGLAVALFAVARLWAPRGWALAAGTLFLAGPLIASVAPRLFVRHYLEALLLAAISLLIHARAQRRDHWGLAVLSAAIYFAAALCKEIAVPLPVVLLLLPAAGGERWSSRARLLVPHAIALLVYCLLRAYLLEPWLSGYGWAAPAGSLPALVGSLAPATAVEIAARQPAGALMLATMIAGTALLLRSTASWLRAGGVAAVALLPILPVALEMQPRFALFGWCALVVGFSCACARLAARGGRGDRQVAIVLMAVALATAAVGNRAQWRSELTVLRRRSAENLAFAGLGTGAYLRRPLEAAAALEELERLKRERFGGPAGAAWFRDDLLLCGDAQIGSLWQYRASSGRVEDASASLASTSRAVCTGIRPEGPLAARFEWRQEGLFWDLHGPAGEFSLVFGEGRERIPVPAVGGYRLEADELVLRVRHDAADGTSSYSPPLALSKRVGALEWSRH